MNDLLIIALIGLAFYVAAKLTGRIRDRDRQLKAEGFLGLAFFITYFAILILF